MKPSELRALTVEELKQKEQDTRKELFNLKFRLATGEVENPKRINALRKDIAKILTITSEKSPRQAGPPGAKKKLKVKKRAEWQKKLIKARLLAIRWTKPLWLLLQGMFSTLNIKR